MCEVEVEVEVEHSNESLDIYSQRGIHLEVAPILTKHFTFLHIYPPNINTTTTIICLKCLDTVLDFHTLYKKVEQICNKDEQIWQSGTAVTIAGLHPPPSLDFEIIKVENDGAIEDNKSAFDTFEGIKLESVGECDKIDATADARIKQVLDHDDDDDLADDHVLNLDYNCIDHSDDGSNLSTRSSSSDRKIIIRKKRTNKKTAKKKATAKKVPIKSHEKKLSIYGQEKAPRTKKDYDAEERRILEYFCLTCKLCGYGANNILDYMNHSQAVHQTRGFLECCDKKFYKKIYIVDHIEWHTNPDQFKCRDCGKTYASTPSLRNHMETHVPLEQRQFQCTHCPQRFRMEHQLKTHQKNRHLAVRNYGCDICAKTFFNKNALTSHILGVHVNAFADFCHICGKEFKRKLSMKLHIQEEHQRQPDRPKLQCTICGSSFKNEHRLKLHFERHNEIKSVCTICQHVSPNKSALSNHMYYVHKERTLQCTLCVKAFRVASELKEHMAVHTGQDLYSCTFCTKTFKFKSNMHGHRKKAHPIEWAALKKDH